MGINATRLFSVLYHKTLTVGRVQTPTLKMLVDRDAKILRFQKEKYYTVGIQSGSLKAGSGRIADVETANLLKEKCTGANAVCTSIRREKKAEQPPKLYDLTTLQREANRLFGFTAKQALDYAQQLYEKKLLTYPRTDSQYLTEDMGQTAQHLVSDLLGLLPFAQGGDLTPEVGRILNSKKVSDHHAIIPTSEFVKQGFTGLAESECKLINLVCSKLLCAIAAPHEYESLEELSEADVAQLAVYDRYSWEYTAFPVGNAVVLIENDRLATALLRLSPKDREIFMMHWFLWMTDEQIAKCMGMARRTVNTRRYKAYRLLKKLMGGEADD